MKMPRMPRSNPLALAVLVSLYERPMHPYEIAHTLRSRAKHESVRLNYGSLYGVVESLERRGLIEAQETTRTGRHPERTTYAITDAGAEEAMQWLAELIAIPQKEYPQFMAGLSFLPALPPEDVATLLRDRVEAIEMRLVLQRGAVATALEFGLPRLFGLEAEYEIAMAEAELGFVRSLLDDLDSGTLDGARALEVLPHRSRRDRVHRRARQLAGTRPEDPASSPRRARRWRRPRMSSTTITPKEIDAGSHRGLRASEALRQDDSTGRNRPRITRGRDHRHPRSEWGRQDHARPRRRDVASTRCRPPLRARSRHRAGFDSGAPTNRPCRPVRGGRACNDREGESGDGGAPLRRSTKRRPSRRRPSAFSTRIWTTQATGSSAPTPVGCAADSTLVRAWSAHPDCSFSTSRHPDSTREAESSSGMRSEYSERMAPTSCSPPSTSTKPTNLRHES